MDNEITKESLFNLNHYEYGEAYFGSKKNMRYRLAIEPLKNVFFTPKSERGEIHLKADVWPGPFAYAKTEKEKITSKLFPFTEEGFEESVSWFNQIYQEQFKWRYDKSLKIVKKII